jgi:sulfite exporter TauE/SafE
MMTLPSILTALSLGLVGSLHCIGMCGPLALALPMRREDPPSRRAFGRLLYNLGRTTTYAAMGLLAGSLGRVIQLNGIQQIVSITLGVLLLLTVFLTTRQLPAWMVNTFYRPVQLLIGKLLKQGSPSGLYRTGVVNGLLPCGLVYAALAKALLEAGPLSGALFMALFGLGTTPLMFALSFGGLRLRSPKFQPVMRRLTPAVTCTVAMLLILRGMSLDIPYISPDLSSDTPCCAH